MEEEKLINSENVKAPVQNEDLPKHKQHETLHKDEEMNEQSMCQFCRELSKGQRITFITFSICNVAVLSLYGMIAPFFPAEASRKGISPVWVGFIFAIFQATIAITAPIFGSIITRVGAKRMYASGILLCGISSILFGFLNLLPDGYIFVIMCLFVRFLQGFGASAFFIANYAILADMFPTNFATIFGILEFCMGVGMTIGPVLGGSLHQVGGYMAPFATVGSSVTAVGLLSIFCLPKYDVATHRQEESYWNLVKVPAVAIVGFCLFLGSAISGFVEVTLSSYLINAFQMSEAQIGLVFLLFAGSFGLAGPIYGLLSDKYTKWSLHFIMCGCFVAGLFLHLIGPAPFLHIPHTLWLHLVSVGVMGCGLASVFLSFPFFIRAAIERGYPNDLATFGLCSGLFNTLFFTGACVGPIIGGILVSELSFEVASAVVGECVIVAALILMIYTICIKKKQDDCKEAEKNCDTSRISSTITQFSQLSEISEETQLLPNTTP